MKKKNYKNNLPQTFENLYMRQFCQLCSSRKKI
jgi:hypothetical protein